MKIFLADDDEDDCLLFRDALTDIDPGITLLAAPGAIALIDALHADINAMPDIIFIDLNMPVKNGVQCLREIMAFKEFRKIPVIMYSTSSNPMEMDECTQIGASGFMIKPNSYQALKSEITKILVESNLITQP